MDTTQIQQQPPAEITDLLEAWNAHEALKASGASVAELIASRDALDALRAELREGVALAS